MESQRVQQSRNHPHAEPRHASSLSQVRAYRPEMKTAGPPVSAVPWSFGRTPLVASAPLPKRQPASQSALYISSTNDTLEREADAIAEVVAGRQNSVTGTLTVSTARAVSAQRKCQECEKEEERKTLSRKEATASAASLNQSVAPAIVHDTLRSIGRPLEDAPRRFMEARFGHDFSRVRVHDNHQAAQSAAAIHARAYTVGTAIVFGESQYAPNTFAGIRLLAHELTHVVQQAGATPHKGPLRTGERGDRFERQAESTAIAITKGASATIRPDPQTKHWLQKDDIASISDFEPADIDPKQAVADPDYVDNGIVEAKLRSNGSIMSPVFLGLDVFYQNGDILDIPAAANSAFPNLGNPPPQRMTVFRRHKQIGKIFPITVTMDAIMAAAGGTMGQKEDAALAASAQFFFDKSITPNIQNAYTNAVAQVAFAYSGLLAQIWNLALGVRGAIQVFTMSGAMRAMAAARAATGAAGAAGPTAVNQATQTALAQIRTQLLKSGTLSAAEQAQVRAVEGRLIPILQRAIQNVNARTATGPWAQRLAGMAQNNPMYRLTLGNAVHEESFNLIQQEVSSGTLPAGMQTNVGRAIPTANLTNSFGRLRPDIRLPLASGREAIWDITTSAQAGHAQPYTSFNFVEYVVELLYP